MNRRSQLVLIALLCTGLATAGCDLFEADIEVDEPVVDDDFEEPTIDEEEEEEEEEEAEVDVDEDMYILAAYETRCVEEEIEDEEEADEIRSEIFARYGFDDESFEAAQGAFEDDEDVELHIDTRMEECDEETARGFAEEGAEPLDEDEEEADEEEADEDGEAAAPAPRPEPAGTGTFEASISGSDFENTRLELRIREDFNVRGEFRGTREGRDFLIPIRGEVSENNSISASGNRRGDSIEIDGRVSENSVQGQATGEVHQNSFRTRYNAQ